ncbi:MAG TPA: hypothetical protein P5232_02705 [Candidatus Moranbacteria bacterium]|nr:hypothetical protein [Candidatus Moranbacteria bacterium]
MSTLIEFQGWRFTTSNVTEIFSKEAEGQAISELNNWKGNFPVEETWVQRTLGIPSLIVRLDCVVKNGKLLIFEIEERPAGIGVTTILNPVFSKKFNNLRNGWPEIKSVVTKERSSCDDYLWTECIPIEVAEKDDCLLLVRAEPEETQFHKFVSRSVSTVITKGDKQYGKEMGLWEEVSITDFYRLPWDSGFCLKPLKGSKCRNVEIWHPIFAKKKSGIGGISTKSRIQKVLGSYGKMYLQKFIEPMEKPGDKSLMMAYRVFFGYDLSIKEYRYLGGAWNARANIKIHGTPDTIMGAVN